MGLPNQRRRPIQAGHPCLYLRGFNAGHLPTAPLWFHVVTPHRQHVMTRLRLQVSEVRFPRHSNLTNSHFASVGVYPVLLVHVDGVFVGPGLCYIFSAESTFGAGLTIRATVLDAPSLRLPSFSGHPISADFVSVGEDVHCESTTPEIHAGVPA